jgi:hypothetical protein
MGGAALDQDIQIGSMPYLLLPYLSLIGKYSKLWTGRGRVHFWTVKF